MLMSCTLCKIFKSYDESKTMSKTDRGHGQFVVTNSTAPASRKKTSLILQRGTTRSPAVCWLLMNVYDAAHTLVHAFIHSRVYYCNAIFVGVSDGVIQKLQSVLHAAARLVTGVRWNEHIIPTLRDTLHYLYGIGSHTRLQRWRLDVFVVRVRHTSLMFVFQLRRADVGWFRSHVSILSTKVNWCFEVCRSEYGTASIWTTCWNVIIAKSTLSNRQMNVAANTVQSIQLTLV